MAERKGEEYRAGELEHILSLAPIKQNIKYLADLLYRTESSIKIVYRNAYEKGGFAKAAKSQK